MIKADAESQSKYNKQSYEHIPAKQEEKSKEKEENKVESNENVRGRVNIQQMSLKQKLAMYKEEDGD